MTAGMAAVCAALAGCGDQNAPREAGNRQAEYVFAYAENQPEGYPTTEGARYFARLVKECSGGRILIQVESDGRLGDEESVFKQLNYGGIDFARISIAHITKDFPNLEVLMLPYLYRDKEHMWNVLDGELGQEFLREFDKGAVTALSWYDAGARSFYNSARPIRRPEDMAGMKIRIQNSASMEDMVTALGAEPVQSVYSQVKEMLELHQVDGAENNVPSYMAENHYLQAKYFTLDEHSRVPEVQLVSDATWEKLSPDDRELLRDCARRSALYERGLWEEYEDYALDTVEKAGCQVIRLTGEEREAFRQQMSVGPARLSAQEAALVERIQSVP